MPDGNDAQTRVIAQQLFQIWAEQQEAKVKPAKWVDEMIDGIL